MQFRRNAVLALFCAVAVAWTLPEEFRGNGNVTTVALYNRGGVNSAESASGVLATAARK